MFQGKRYQPNTKFEFINYEQSSSQSFKNGKKTKSQIPYTMKFQLDGIKPRSQTSIIHNDTQQNKYVPLEQQHTFISGRNHPKNSRKASYTISTNNQKQTLLNLMLGKSLFSAKSKLDTWSEIIKDYNELYNLDNKEGLTVQHARVKYNQILSIAKGKQLNGGDLTNYEILALKYDDSKTNFKYNYNKDVKLDSKYENKTPKFTKIYEIIIELETKINNLSNQIVNLGINSKYKYELWLFQKRISDLKKIEEQYQILEQVDYNTDGKQIKVSKEMKNEISGKLEILQNDFDELNIKIEKDLKNGLGDKNDSVVDTELLDKK
ncbi:hypothetical protein BN7_1483 [Wickerhamomyces ciferrii]|uniref:Uncharacterized protein n=1 Tax=Wickerhamomyces ciferrii (strain ATCC 14091 / BCRC 22168 / CBS 111 / JCM 3599 / NBRC 0793 / NRRL Y-1031 F-60-10) TaxID=1206466 RepID=K0KKE4_WICCF|nr:uncharacterized protein BN7_1483 [Wickerhamomyces ciferrii]CCH41944.1 hypothetical protein BN7_1483 [Wickerhamomyces ciferrii]